LPTESEWEYACRAGTTGAWSGGPLQTLRCYAWYRDIERPAKPQVAKPVRRKRPNAFGVYDMHGNLSEWCEWDPDPGKLPAYADTRLYMPIRGGKFDDTARYLRSAKRFWWKRNSHGQNGVGFRVVSEIGPRDR
jgi:formylglycine-generating enzyme required for sulfatase activity